jgi:hypothetical protein
VSGKAIVTLRYRADICVLFTDWMSDVVSILVTNRHNAAALTTMQVTVEEGQSTLRGSPSTSHRVAGFVSENAMQRTRWPLLNWS